ncbi:MAG: redox-sensing transcriptional repressor Rex [Christensenellales bacterium]|jgi:redox-sensing transcriptional repressor
MDSRHFIEISNQTLKRLPEYHRFLQKTLKEGKEHVSSPVIAQALGFSDIQVRKDLAAVSDSPGRPRIGFNVQALIFSIAKYLGYDTVDEAVLVGVGRLGSALLCYRGFLEIGMKITAGFDCDPDKTGLVIDGKRVYPMDAFDRLVKRLGVRIGIIAVPVQQAQEVCRKMANSGIEAIWNFAPVHLEVPKNIILKNENLASSFASLSIQLKGRRGVAKKDKDESTT